jgi:hypothetical protein
MRVGAYDNRSIVNMRGRDTILADFAMNK